MKTSRYIFVLFFCLIFFGGSAQKLDYGILPALTLNKDISSNKAFTFNYQQRNLFFNSSTKEWNHRQVLSDYTFFYKQKIGLNTKVAIGSLIRFAKGIITIRTLQQVSFSKSFTHFKVGQRTRFDQTFYDNLTTFRLRYRIGFLIPIQGRKLDNKELYIKLNNEYLNQFEKKQYELEIRLIPVLGYTLSKRAKLEFGYDYRLSGLNSPNLKQVLWSTVSLHLNF